MDKKHYTKPTLEIYGNLKDITLACPQGKSPGKGDDVYCHYSTF